MPAGMTTANFERASQTLCDRCSAAGATNLETAMAYLGGSENRLISAWHAASTTVVTYGSHAVPVEWGLP